MRNSHSSCARRRRSHAGSCARADRPRHVRSWRRDTPRSPRATRRRICARRASCSPVCPASEDRQPQFPRTFSVPSGRRARRGLRLVHGTRLWTWQVSGIARLRCTVRGSSRASGQLRGPRRAHRVGSSPPIRVDRRAADVRHRGPRMGRRRGAIPRTQTLELIVRARYGEPSGLRSVASVANHAPRGGRPADGADAHDSPEIAPGQHAVLVDEDVWL